MLYLSNTVVYPYSEPLLSLALELGLTYINLLTAIATADRARLLRTCKAMLLMIRGHNTRGKYADEIVRFLVQQTAVLSELEAHRVLYTLHFTNACKCYRQEQ